MIDEHFGGVRGGWGNPRIIPGGASMQVIVPEEAEVALMDFDSLKQVQIRPRHRHHDRNGQVH